MGRQKIYLWYFRYEKPGNVRKVYFEMNENNSFTRSLTHSLTICSEKTICSRNKQLKELCSSTGTVGWRNSLLTAINLICFGKVLLVLVSYFASSREIKKAFHRLALKHHPDKSQSPNAQQTFTHIAQAYEVLSDREKRRVYDQMDHLTNPDRDRKRTFKKDENEDVDSNPFVHKGAFHSKRSFQDFSLEELLHTLRMDDDFFMGEQPGYEGWSFIFGPEDDDDETVLLSDLFNML
ncbi:J domain-containing protein DDB_G0295729 isoform X1 [Labeo rohita]|uniref:J domain-containing protein DDB_G0295729 isoform X1 n=1 Tax=Labeo rohita TaxID=84645 RepID=UPI0021E2AD95|nr:J domain-containing protein DDB_G0295729 isoform X1 [Labeo rohita]